MAVLVVLVVVGVLAFAGGGSGGNTKYSDLKAGDCFKKPSGRFNNVDKVPCTEKHDLEVYAVVQHPAKPGEAFPGGPELVRYANPLCLAQFKAYAGVAFETLNLKDVYITPRDSAWKDGARTIVCAVQAGDEQPTTKSIKR